VNNIIHNFFNWCVKVLEYIGDITGMGYELVNIVIFVFLQPALILLFFFLWINVKVKNGIQRSLKKSSSKSRRGVS